MHRHLFRGWLPLFPKLPPPDLASSSILVFSSSLVKSDLSLQPSCLSLVSLPLLLPFFSKTSCCSCNNVFRAFFEVFLLNFPLLGLLLCLYSLFLFDIPAFETKDGAGLFKAVTVLVATIQNWSSFVFCYLASAARNRNNWKEKEHVKYDRNIVSNIFIVLLIE